MLTPRGFWFVLFVGFLFVYGVLGQFVAQRLTPASWETRLSNTDSASLLALTLGLWFGWQWLDFAFRVRRTVRRLTVQRQLRDEHGPVDALWSGRTVRVHVDVNLPAGTSLGHLAVADRVPFAAELAGGLTRYEGPAGAERSIRLRYALRCPATGPVRFEGLRVEVADLQGFFYHAAFLPAAAVLRVLPPLVDARGHAPTVKRHNLLPPPGLHRHRRPGSGGELLDLRDYLPGDPPKTIAWKVSARRDRLITKEFESEVPVRCTLFVDTSNSVRVGPPGQNALADLVRIASAVAQAAAGGRDLVGLSRFDEHVADWVRPARGPRHLAQLLGLLTDAGGLAPTTGAAPVNTLLPLAYSFAQEVYPDQMRSDVNRFPAWLAWLAPRPAYAVRHRSVGDFIYRWLPILLPLYLVGGLVVLGGIFLWAWNELGTGRHPVYLLLAVLVVAAFALPLGYLRIPAVFFFPERRRRARWRKQLAALLSVRYDLAPGGLALLAEDDEAFSRYAQRFLADHQVPYALPLYDPQGHYLFAAPGKVEVLAGALIRAVGKGHDNELFVLLADLLELAEALDPLLRAVKVALARHHRVMVICPWPPGVPPPDGRGGQARRHGEEGAVVASVVGEEMDEHGPIAEALARTTTARFHRAYREVRRTFGRLGVPVASARSGDPPRLILDKLDLVRAAGRRR